MTARAITDAVVTVNRTWEPLLMRHPPGLHRCARHPEVAQDLPFCDSSYRA